MSCPKPEATELSDQAQRDLEKLVNRHTTGQQKAQRVRIILEAAARRHRTRTRPVHRHGAVMAATVARAGAN